MGCVCSKGIDTDKYNGTRREKGLRKSSRRLVAPSRREEVIVEGDSGGGNDGSERLISKSQEIVLPTLASDEGEVKEVIERLGKALEQRAPTADIGETGGEHNLRIYNVPNGAEGELITAGWPSWLTAVAGEAIKGWLPRRADSFERLDKVSFTLHYLPHVICKTMDAIFTVICFV